MPPLPGVGGNHACTITCKRLNGCDLSPRSSTGTTRNGVRQQHSIERLLAEIPSCLCLCQYLRSAPESQSPPPQGEPWVSCRPQPFPSLLLQPRGGRLTSSEMLFQMQKVES